MKNKKPEYTKIGNASLRVPVTELYEQFKLCTSEYRREHKRMQVLDLTDRGGLWEALGAKFPAYQILPDTNHVAYIKNNLIASIYTVAKCAELLPTSEDDKEIITNVNIALEQEWSLTNIAKMQKQAGNNAALHNIGITQIGWDENVISSGNTIQKGQVRAKNISPLKFMRDPYAIDLKNAGYCMTYDKFHKSVFLSNKNYREKFKEYLESRKHADTALSIPEVIGAKSNSAHNDYYTLVTFWEKVEDEDGNIVIDEIHTVNAEAVLYVRNAIKPNKFPFAILYCNEPGDALIGISEPARIFANSVAYNIMDSISLTSAYKNQRPPKFVSSSAGLNINSFAKHANDADYTFIVNGDATKAVHYHQFPQVDPHIGEITLRLDNNIKQVTGVDERYTGRDTGSIITTGGIQDQINRVTVIDTPKIENFEDYAKQLTELVLANLIEFGAKRKYIVKSQTESNTYKTVNVDFPKLNVDAVFNYQLNISSELPRNKARIAEMANQLMEKQLQYQQQGESVDLITVEEWLMMQDLPMKEYMLERMGIQRMNNEVENVSQTLFEFAELTKQGMNPQDALMATAKSLRDKKAGLAPDQVSADPLAAAGVMPAETPMPQFGGAPAAGGGDLGIDPSQFMQ
jgi:hypothetical protein